MLAFVHVAKTAGATMDRILANSYGAAYCHAEHMSDFLPAGDRSGDFTVPKYDRDDFRRLRRLCPWMRCLGGHAVTIWSGIEQVVPTRYFAFLREPVARGASHYQYHVAHEADPLGWEQWTEWEVHRNHQLKMFSPDVDVAQAISNIERLDVFLGLMERFDESLLLLQRFVAPDLRLGYERRNVAKKNDLAADLLADPVKRAQLETMYAGDIELYEYVRREIFPRYRERYGPQLADDLAAYTDASREGFGTWRMAAHRLQRRFWIEPWGRFHRRRGR